MQIGSLILILCVLLGISGCILSSSSSLNWSENVAISAAGTDPKFHDDNLYTEGETTTIREDAN